MNMRPTASLFIKLFRLREEKRTALFSSDWVQSENETKCSSCVKQKRQKLLCDKRQ